MIEANNTVTMVNSNPIEGPDIYWRQFCMFSVSNKITTLPRYLVCFNLKATEDCAADPAVFLVFCVRKTQHSFLYVSFTSHASTPHTTLDSDNFGHQTRGGLPHPAIPPGQWVPYNLIQF